MNVRSHQKQSQIRTINFQEHVSGFIQSKKREQKYSAASSPNHSRSVIRPQTSYNKKFETYNMHPMSGRPRRQPISHREPQNANEHEDDQQGSYQQWQVSGEEKRQMVKQQQRHIQFVKSYQHWLKQTQVEEYQSSRMINSFALKKTRASLKPKKEPQVFQFKAYQPHFNQEYHPPKLFPSRTHQSLKKMQPKNISHTRNYQRTKHKNEGQLKLQIMKSIAKKQAAKQEKPQRTSKVRSIQQNDKNLSLFMKTFSNPKLLSIKNGQLVTGTKIVFIN